MNIKTRLEKLEARSATDATLCPHLPPLLREFAPDGTERMLAAMTYNRYNPRPDVARDAVCECGRPRMEVHIRETETPFPVQPDARDVFK